MARIVIHADDFGLCQPVNEAISGTFHAPLTATSVMVPCPGFEEAVKMYHDGVDDRSFDVGLHFTLTTGGFVPKYAPLSQDASSLLGDDGFLWSSVADASTHLIGRDVLNELVAQFDHATEFGIDLTHLDAHMFIGSIPIVEKVMLRQAWDWRVPVVLKDSKQRVVPSFDSVVSLKNGMDIEGYFANLQGSSGTHYLILHPAVPGELVMQHLPNTFSRRVEDYHLCQTNQLEQWLVRYGLTTVGMREIREEWSNRNIWL